MSIPYSHCCGINVISIDYNITIIRQISVDDLLNTGFRIRRYIIIINKVNKYRLVFCLINSLLRRDSFSQETAENKATAVQATIM